MNNQSMPVGTSECSVARDELAKFCEPHCLEIGFGGDVTVPWAITFDLPQKYTTVGRVPQMVRGDCRNLSMFCDNSFRSIVNHHLIEDFKYEEIVRILREWRRVLQPGGLLVTNTCDQQKFLAHCARTGQPTNLAHANEFFNLDSFLKTVEQAGGLRTIYTKDDAGPYSFYVVCQKV